MFQVIPSILGAGQVLTVELVELYGPWPEPWVHVPAVYTRVHKWVDWDEAFLSDGTGRYRTVVQ